MDVIARNVTVRMIRPDLEGIPRQPLPPGYSVRWYRPGDAQTWLAVQSATERLVTITPDMHPHEFGTDPNVLGRRQCFLLNAGGIPVGTATAWFGDDERGRSWGRLHWLAIVPQEQGLGLGKALLATACGRMRELGHKQAYLVTSTGRIPAINLYLRFGFVPEILTADDAAAWNEMRPHVSVPLPPA